MKFLAIVGSIHFEPEIKKLLKGAEIGAYSQTNINGHNESDGNSLRGNWFAMTEGYKKSVIFFSFTHSEKASEALKLVSEYNNSIATKSKIRAFIMPIEQNI